MSEKKLIKQLKKLPSEAQEEAADFVEFLSKKYLQQSEETDSSKKKSILESSFRGM
jgi:mRNA-degrading endonuclease RelE of RelBE toxin-antitoxin system